MFSVAETVPPLLGGADVSGVGARGSLFCAARPSVGSVAMISTGVSTREMLRTVLKWSYGDEARELMRGDVPAAPTPL